MTQRIAYIDLIKGFSISWVVLFHIYVNYHTTFLDWLFIGYRMPLFFFLSGIFFRKRSFNEFTKKKINTLIVPFITFWIVGLLYLVFKYQFIPHFVTIQYQDQRSFSEYALSFLNLFYLRPNISPCYVNGPLWFLIALFITQHIHFLVTKFIPNKYIIIIITIGLFILSNILSKEEISGLFYISNALALYPYYMLGNLYGTNLINLIENKRQTIVVMTVCLILSFILPVININPSINQIIFFIRTVSFITIIFIFFKNTNHWLIFKPLMFFGQHSLEILVTHMLVLNFTQALLSYILFHTIHPHPSPDSALVCLGICFFIVMLLEYFVVIKLCNKVPLLIGKKPLLKV